MLVPTGTVFEFAEEDFEDALLRIETVSFEPVDGVFHVNMVLLLGLFGRYLVDRAPGGLIKEALEHTLIERNLPTKLLSSAFVASNSNALGLSFCASIEAFDGDTLEVDHSLTENTDYCFISPRCVEIGPTGVIKLGADPRRIAEEALALLPKRYHWLSIQDNYQDYLKSTEAGFLLNLETIDYEKVIENDDADDEFSPLGYVVLTSQLRLWR